MTARTKLPTETSPARAPTPQPEVRAKVKSLLEQSPAFHQLPRARQQQVARDTALVADALVGKESFVSGLRDALARLFP